MAFKNPNNVITLSDDITEYIAVNGVYYSDTRNRYPDMPRVVVRCDRCGKCPLACCIGVDNYGTRPYDLCMSCVEVARTSKLSVKDLEDCAGFNKDELTASMEDLTTSQSMRRHDTLDVDGNLTETELSSQYIFSDIQRAQLEALYEYLVEYKAEHFRLTKAESDEFMVVLMYIPSSMVFKTILNTTSQVPICHPNRVVLNSVLDGTQNISRSYLAS